MGVLESRRNQSRSFSRNSWRLRPLPNSSADFSRPELEKKVKASNINRLQTDAMSRMIVKRLYGAFSRWCCVCDCDCASHWLLKAVDGGEAIRNYSGEKLRWYSGLIGIAFFVFPLCFRNLSHNMLTAVDTDILSNLPNLKEVWVEICLSIEPWNITSKPRSVQLQHEIDWNRNFELFPLAYLSEFWWLISDQCKSLIATHFGVFRRH